MINHRRSRHHLRSMVLLGAAVAAAAAATSGCAASTPRPGSGLPRACAADSPGRGVIVLGNVNAPGELTPTKSDAARPMTLTGAIDRAGGLTPIAWATHVKVRRTSCDGRTFAARFDVNAIREGSFPDPILAPGDVVYVGEREV